MADWSGVKVDPSDINGGKEYEAQKDRVSIEAFNAIVNNSIYSAEASAEALDKANSVFQGNGTIVRVGGVEKGFIDFDYDPQEQINKFYWSDQYYSSGETVQGTAKVKLEVFGDIDIEVPRDGLYEVTAYIYCYTSSGNSSYYLYMDNVEGSNNATILGQEPQAHPLATTFMLTKGTHRLNVYANSSSGSREFILATYYVNQLIVKEI